MRWITNGIFLLGVSANVVCHVPYTPKDAFHNGGTHETIGCPVVPHSQTQMLRWITRE